MSEVLFTPSAWKNWRSRKCVSAVEDAHCRDDQDHTKYELEHRSRDHSDEEASYHRPDYRPHPHRCDRLGKVGAVREGAEPTVPEYSHRYGRQADQQACCPRRLDTSTEGEDERRDDDLSASDA